MVKRQIAFRNIVRLRRAGRQAPNPDVAAVLAELERELGATVSQRFAADVLGVSHTALRRWIDSGDLPLVYGRGGRMEIPVDVLVDLYEEVERERAQGSRGRHLLEPSMLRARERAQMLRTADLARRSRLAGEGHVRSELRSLAYHRAVAARLDRPAINDARQTLWKWRAEGKVHPRYAEQWDQALQLPLAELRRVLVEDTERGRDLRQNSPFAGTLSEAERRRILHDIR